LKGNSLKRNLDAHILESEHRDNAFISSVVAVTKKKQRSMKQERRKRRGNRSCCGVRGVGLPQRHAKGSGDDATAR